MYAPSQLETTLQCNVVSHWLGTFTKRPLQNNHRNCDKNDYKNYNNGYSIGGNNDNAMKNAFDITMITMSTRASAVYFHEKHYSDVMKSTIASQITGVSIVYSTVCSGTGQRKHQSSQSLAFVKGIHRWPVNSPHKWPVTRKMAPFDDVIMIPRTKYFP